MGNRENQSILQIQRIYYHQIVKVSIQLLKDSQNIDFLVKSWPGVYKSQQSEVIDIQQFIYKPNKIIIFDSRMKNQEEEKNAMVNSKKQSLPDKKEIKRTKRHEAILKVKEVEDHLDMMKRRNKYLQVRDQRNRSMTIQHERKLQRYDEIRGSIKRDRDEIDRMNRLRNFQQENAREKNTNFRDQHDKMIAQSLQKYLTQKVEGYQQIKMERVKNQEQIVKLKKEDLKEKKQVKKIVNQMQEISRKNIQKFRQLKHKQALQHRSSQINSFMQIASSKEKELMKYSRLQQDMVKRHSESMQASQILRNRLRQVLGDDRRFTKLPSLNNSSTRNSTGNTQIIII